MTDWRRAAEGFERFEDPATVGARLCAAGITRVVMPPVDAAQLCAAREALAYRSAFADAVLAVIGLGSYPVAAAGTAEQKARYLEPVASGAVCGFALTEPEAGSDVAGMQATARRDGDDYVL